MSRKGGRKEKESLARRQGGVSPISGESLSGRRLSTHHKTELNQGGKNVLRNKIVLPVEEHVMVHLLRSRDDKRNEEDKGRERRSAMENMRDLNDEELLRLNEGLRRRGTKLKFL